MSMSDRIRECRIQNGLSQAELAERLFVSRQAVSKWESGKGAPDIENLKALSQIFGVSVDYLLDDESTLVPEEAIVRTPVDVASLEPRGRSFRARQSRANKAVRMVYPDATIWPLARRPKNSKSQEALEWVNAILFDGPFNIFATANLFSNRDCYYIVEERNRNLMVRVSAEAVEARVIDKSVDTKKFTVGLDFFRRHSRPLP